MLAPRWPRVRSRWPSGLQAAAPVGVAPTAPEPGRGAQLRVPSRDRQQDAAAGPTKGQSSRSEYPARREVSRILTHV